MRFSDPKADELTRDYAWNPMTTDKIFVENPGDKPIGTIGASRGSHPREARMELIVWRDAGLAALFALEEAGKIPIISPKVPFALRVFAWSSGTAKAPDEWPRRRTRLPDSVTSRSKGLSRTSASSPSCGYPFGGGSL